MEKQVVNIRLNWSLHANQKVIHNDRARFRVVKAGKRFGKSKLAVFELCQWSVRKPGGVFWYVAPTYGQAEDIAWNDFLNIFPKDLIERTIGTKLTVITKMGSRVVLKGANNEDTLRGPGVDGYVIDEAAYIQSHVWPNILYGQLVKSMGPTIFISSPLSRQRKGTMVDWYPGFCAEAKRKMQAGDKDWSYYHYTIYDNPILNKQEIENIKAACTEDAWSLEYMAEEDIYAGALISEFNFDKHVGEFSGAEFKYNCRGIDWGMDHPTVCLWATFDPNRRLDPITNPVYIHDEFFKSGNVIKESCETIKMKSGNRQIDWTVIDPSTRKRNSQNQDRSDADEFSRNGVTCIMGDNRNVGYDVMKMFFKYDLIKINPKCKNLINQVRELQWGQKDDDDCTDALRYMLLRIHNITYLQNTFKDISVPVENKICMCEFDPNICKVHRRECSLFDFDDMGPRRNGAVSHDWLYEEAL